MGVIISIAGISSVNPRVLATEILCLALRCFLRYDVRRHKKVPKVQKWQVAMKAAAEHM